MIKWFFIIIGACSSLVADVSLPKEAFYFVRHGKTDWSKEMIKEGPLNLPLNDQGKGHAENAALILEKILKEENIAIISSNLKRSQETAAFIAERLGQKVEVYEDLHERYWGDFRFLKEGGLPLNAESEENFKSRVYNSFSNLLSDVNFKGKKKIVVSHSGVFKCLSLILTKEVQEINFGEVILFVTDGKNWKSKKINLVK